MKKVFLLLLIFPLIQLACEKEDYGSCENKPYFNITGIELNAVGKVQQPNGAGSETVLKDQDAVPFNSFKLYGSLKADYYASYVKTSLSFFPKAVATTPCPILGWKGSEEKLSGLHLIALSKYNANFQTGDTLADAFLINDQPVSEYLEANKQNIIDQRFTLTLTEKPDPKELQSFKLIYQLTNGESYEVTTPRFKLY